MVLICFNLQPSQNEKENVQNKGSGRGQKEYHEAATIAAKLWINQNNGGVNVVLTIVHHEDAPPKDLKDYAADVENENVKVLFEKAGNMSCPLKAGRVIESGGTT